MTATTGEDSILEETQTVAAAGPRPLGVVLVVAGVVHLLVPGLLLWLAGVGYDWLLRIRFEPQDTASRRVRLFGIGMLAAGAHLLYHGGIRPSR